MAKRVGKRTIVLDKKPYIIGYGSVVGKKEFEGPLGHEFDAHDDDSRFGEDSYEKAESLLQKIAIETAMRKANVNENDINMIFAGDLLNQCIGSYFGLRAKGIPLVGLYGACSTMTLGLSLASIMVDSGTADIAAAVTSSHFCSAERQYRFPLEYGAVRPQTAQWTVTGSGATILSSKKCEGKPYINAVCFGEIEDLGVTDTNNMGAAMAPDDVKIRPYPTHEGMVFFYTQIQYLRGLRALFKDFLTQKIVEKSVNEIRNSSSIH